MAKHKPQHPTKKTAPKKYVPPIAQRGITAPTPPLSSADAAKQLRGY